MAKRIKAISARLERSGTVGENVLAQYIENHSSLKKGDVAHALLELGAAIETFMLLGHSVRLKGVGLITPSMNTKGELSIRILPDAQLRRAINDRGRFSGTIANAHNLDKSGEELVVQWNERHPDDPVED